MRKELSGQMIALVLFVMLIALVFVVSAFYDAVIWLLENLRRVN